MRIVISGYYGFENIGDEAILYAILSSLKELDPEIQVIVLSGNPAYTKKKYKVDAVNRWSLKETALAIKTADMLISGGGSLFQDQTSNKNIWYYAGVIRLARILKKPVLVYAQGIGPISRGKNKLLVKKVFQSAQSISVRDVHSKQLLESIGVSRPIQVVPDPALGIDPTEFQSKWLAERNLVQKKITVSIREWSQDLGYFQEIASALDDLAAKGYAIIFVPMHGLQDEKSAKQVKGLMSQEAYIAPADCSIKEKIAIIKESEVLLGMRLHALIFAAICNIPFAALSYDPKIDAFASIVEQKVIGNVTDNNWNASDIIAAINAILNNYGEEQNKIVSHVCQLKEQNNHVIQELIKSFINLKKMG